MDTNDPGPRPGSTPATTWSVGLLLAGLVLGCAVSPDGAARDNASRKERPMATLGMRTSAPTEVQAQALGLEHNVRYRGQVVEQVLAGGPAEGAGLQAGDALLRLDRNELYSQDDVADFLRVSAPGNAVEIEFTRQGWPESRTVSLSLGSTPGEAVDGPRFEWQHAGVAQLEQALGEARARKKKVLVGLSGAET